LKEDRSAPLHARQVAPGLHSLFSTDMAGATMASKVGADEAIGMVGRRIHMARAALEKRRSSSTRKSCGPITDSL
jgi:hypothetical protein